MTDLPDQELARVLAVPMRRRILDLVAAAKAPLSVAELTDALGCNHNAVRQHLARLCEVGLVDEHVENRTEPGRPRLLYSRASRPNPYARLAALLAETVRSRTSPREVGRRQGRALARTLDGDAISALEREAARQGFAPRRIERRSGTDLVLDACPYAEVAAGDPRTICALHRGLAEGLVEGRGGARVEALVVQDPYDAGCVVQVRPTR